MKILVIFTGGTIGSSAAADGYFSPDETKPYKLLELYRKMSGDETRFETAEPYRTLSENLSGSHIRELLACIRRGIQKGYDGIIVTHGTDTLQYTASALGYALGNASIPVVLVSSNYILENPKANGLQNFYYGVQFIRSQAGRGVFVSYKNEGKEPAIHRGTRLLPHEPYEDALYSIGKVPYGRFENCRFEAGGLLSTKAKTERFIKNPGYWEKEDEIPCLDWKWKDELSGILWIWPYVGMVYPAINENIKAVLLGSYHSGTINTKSCQLRNFAEEAGKKGIPVYLTGARAGDTYESVKPLSVLGICVLPEISPIAAYMKLSMALWEGRKLSSVMSGSLGGDLV